MSEPELETADPADDDEPVETIEGDDEDVEGAPEPEPEPDNEPESEAIAAERDQEWERVRRYLAKNLGEIEGDDAVHYIDCILCRSYGTPGFINPSAGLDPQVASDLMNWLGMADPADLKPDPDAVTCQVCNGWGEVTTGSKVQGQQSLPCMECQGKGWLPTEASRRGRGYTVSNGPVPALTPSDEIGPTVISEDLSPEAAAAKQQGYIVIPTASVA